MADRSVRVVLSVVGAGFSAGMAKAAADTKSLTSTIQKHSAEVDKLSSGMLLAGAGIAAGIGIAVKAYADFDEAMSHVAATGADAKANLEQLSQVALKAGADTKYSATEAAQGMEALFKAGVSAADVIGGGLTSALNLAAAGNMSVADSADFMATAMKNFNVPGTESARVADAIAAAANKAQGDVSDMAAAFKYVSIPARDAKMSVEQTAGAIAELAAAGIIGEQAGTSLRSVLMSLTAPSKLAQKEIENLGLTLYDSNGQWLGYTNAVDQLSTKLGPLSDAERDMALGTIFGNEAISTARILMSGGAADAQKWTDAVSDAGYAQQLASDRMNNLKGDLEQLSGSFETTMIKFGSAADGPLRGLVQGLTDVVNVAGNVPTPIQEAGAAIGGTAAAGLLLAGGLGKAVVAINETKTAMAVLGITARGATLAMGAVGIALTVAGVALGSWLASEADAKAIADDFTAAMQGQADAVNGATKAVAAKKLADTGGFEAAKALGLSYSTVVDASLGNAAAQDKVKVATDAARLSADQIAASAQNASGAMTGQAQAAGGATMAQVQLNNAAVVLAQSLGLTSDGFNRAIAEMKAQDEAAKGGAASIGQFAMAVSGVTGPTDMLSQSQKDLVAQTNTARDATSRNADALKKAADATWAVIDANLAASGSEIGLKQAIADATETINGNKKTLDLNTQAGRDNQGALDGIVKNTEAVVLAMAKNGAGSTELTAKINEGRDAFIKQAEKIVGTKGEAEKLWETYKLNPGVVETMIRQQGAEAASQAAQDLRARIGEIPTEHQSTFLASVNQGDLASARAQLDAAAAARTAYIYVRTIGVATQGAVNQSTVGSNLYATGGYVRGPGSTTSDSILARLSDREFVFNADAVSGIGLARLNYMNRYGKLPGFADGGFVHYSNAVPRYASGGAVSAASSGGVSASSDLASAVRAALSGAELRLTGAVDTIGDAVSARIVLAYEGAV